MHTRLHIILLRIAVSLGVTAGGLMLLSAVKTKDAKPCSRVEVHFINGVASGFVPVSEVQSNIREVLKDEPVGHALQDFDLKAIEKKLETHAWVYDAQLYFDNTQTLHVTLHEVVPVARIIDAAGKHFYIDMQARELPLSKDYRADLPVFTNLPVNRKEGAGLKTIQRVCQLARALAADSFWMAQAAQIDILPNGKMEMIPVIGNHIVELSYAQDPEEMLLRLKYFYKAMASSGRLNEYVRVNAGFAGQIVAQRAAYQVGKAEGNAAMNTYLQIVNTNKNEVNANSVVAPGTAGQFVSEAPEQKTSLLNRSPKGNKKENEKEKKEETVTPVIKIPEGAPEKKEEKKTDTKEERIPKAIMPKAEKNN